MDLNILWFFLLGVLLAGYAILDGFDFGVGILAPLAKTDHEKRVILNSIGPIWDGNEVWLVTFGGAMFAAFPELYATVFSGYYIAFMLVLLALIMRAVSIEFRSKMNSRLWKRVWDSGFFLSSLLASLLFGVAIGSIMVGVPVDRSGIYAGTFFDIVLPKAQPLFPLLVGLLTAALFTMHGAIYLYLKTEGELQQRVRGWMWHGFGVFLALYLTTTIMALTTIRHAALNFTQYPWTWLIVIVSILAIANIPRAVYNDRPAEAFVSSSIVIASLVGLVGIALFPDLLVSSLSAENNLNIYNAASSDKTLGIMALIAALGMPFVLAYTAVIYWTYRGKVQLGDHSY
jgi:cytochrome bd ubiquinol oxidase subunit II